MSPKSIQDASVGDELTPFETIVTDEIVERIAWANDDYNPWYLDDSPFGGRIAQPTLLMREAIKMQGQNFILPEGGFRHAREDYEFINPLKVGKRVKITGKLIDKYNKGGRDYYVLEFLAVDEDGLEIVKIIRYDATAEKR